MRFLNPDIEIYGLYGGQEELFPDASEQLKEVLTHNYLIKGKDREWKWKNSDKAYLLWFNDFGHTLDFDMLHSFEWDMLYFASLDRLFEHVPENSAAFTGLTRLKKIEKKWYWTGNAMRKLEWVELMNYFRNHWAYNSEPYAMIGPGASFPGVFFEKSREIEIPEVLNDEIRLPLLMQVLGLEMYDTYFFRKWFSKREYRFFNANEFDIEMKTIIRQLKKKKGRRAFHPYRNDLTYDELLGLYKLI